MTLWHTVIVVLINLLWGSMFIAAAIGLREFPPIFFTGIRFGLLVVLLFYFLRVPQRLIGPLFKIGLVMGVGMYLTLYLSLTRRMPSQYTTYISHAPPSPPPPPRALPFLPSARLMRMEQTSRASGTMWRRRSRARTS